MTFDLNEIFQLKADEPLMTVTSINPEDGSLTCPYRSLAGAMVRATVMPVTAKIIDPRVLGKPISVGPAFRGGQSDARSGRAAKDTG